LKVLYQLHDRLSTLISVDSNAIDKLSNTTIKHNISISNLSSLTSNAKTPALIIQCQLNIIRCWIGLGHFAWVEVI
jgi:hypothetical protein